MIIYDHKECVYTWAILYTHTHTHYKQPTKSADVTEHHK